jgi:photosynthetic reaction center cytochrome c subunit
MGRRANGFMPLCVSATVVVSAAVALLQAQGTPPRQPPLAEDVFKNVQVLRGIPVDEFMDTMGMFSAATGLNCAHCHAIDNGGGWEGYAIETPLKRTARRMLRMVTAINKDNFGGTRTITCNTCHRGDQRPKPVPSLTIQYSAPAEDPNDIDSFPASGMPSADSLFDKYLQALGGRARVESLTSIAARGTYAGYDTDHAKVPVEVFSRTPAARTTIVHTKFGDRVRAFDGTQGWVASADRPLLLMPLTGGNLAGARVDTLLSFPVALKQAFARWRVTRTTIDDNDTYVVQSVPPAGQTPVNLYFDVESGLLVRALRFTDTAVGRVPTQIDFSDYRDVEGTKLPFRIISTWTDGQSTIEFTDVRTNVAIDPARFRQPPPAAPLK